jgi:ribonuclease HII
LNELWVGFDEAGLGPILGPLSLSIFISSKDFEFPILDSKKVHKKNSLSPLLKKCNQYCSKFDHKIPNPKCADLNSQSRGKEPWFIGDDHQDGFDVFFEHHEDQIHLYSRLIAVSDYNKVLDSGLNKADTVLHFLKPMVEKIFEHAKDYDRVNLMFDRLGGRKKYRPILEAWGLNIASSNENPEVSRYYGSYKDQAWDIAFRVKGDLYHHTTAAASMFAKLRREMAMQRMNQWWQARVPELKPTAGYWTDGLRFLKDIDLCRSNLKISEHLLRRNK